VVTGDATQGNSHKQQPQRVEVARGENPFPRWAVHHGGRGVSVLGGGCLGLRQSHGHHNLTLGTALLGAGWAGDTLPVLYARGGDICGPGWLAVTSAF